MAKFPLGGIDIFSGITRHAYMASKRNRDCFAIQTTIMDTVNYLSHLARTKAHEFVT